MGSDPCLLRPPFFRPRHHFTVRQDTRRSMVVLSTRHCPQRLRVTRPRLSHTRMLPQLPPPRLQPPLLLLATGLRSLQKSSQSCRSVCVGSSWLWVWTLTSAARFQTLLLYIQDVLAVASLEVAASSRDAAAAAAARAASAARAAAVTLPVLASPDVGSATPASPSASQSPPRSNSRSRRAITPTLSPSFIPFADRLVSGLFDCVLHPLLLFTLAAGASTYRVMQWLILRCSEDTHI